MLILLKESKTGYDSGVFYNQLSSANNHKCFYVSLLKILLKHKNFETLKTVKCPYCHTWEKYIGLSGSNFNLYNGKCQGEYNNSSSPPPLTPTLQARHPKTSYNIHIYYKHAILYWWPTKYWCINLVSVTAYRIRGQRKQTDINQSQT